MNEIVKCEEIRKKREELHIKLRAKVDELLAEAKKRGHGNKHGVMYETEIEMDGEHAKVTAKQNDDTFLRANWQRRGEIYYVSKYDTPPARTLAEGVAVLKAMIEKFNEDTKRDASDIEKASMALEGTKI